MRFRFTIRDLLWLTALVAIVLAWSLDRVRTEQMRLDYRHMREHRDALLEEISSKTVEIQGYKDRLHIPSDNQ